MNKVKTVTTTIEDEVVFMTDPDIQFVSLVKHGANRTPFKVLKNYKSKEGTGMEKVVQAILVRNDLPEDQIAKALEGMSKKNTSDSGSITSYVQCPMERCNEETVMVVKHEEVKGVYHVLADLKEEGVEAGTLMVEVGKEAVDYATLDNLYTELYAMADIVSGAMRQENAGVEFRKDTILSAISNFKSFAEVVLNNLGTAEKADMAVKIENHPTLLPFIRKEEEKEGEAEAGEKEGEEPAAEVEGEEPAAAVEGEEPAVKENVGELVVTAMNKTLGDFAKGLETIFGTMNENMEKSMKSVVDKVDEIKMTTVSAKSETDEQNTVIDKSENPFAGVLFRG